MNGVHISSHVWGTRWGSNLLIMPIGRWNSYLIWLQQVKVTAGIHRLKMSDQKKKWVSWCQLLNLTGHSSIDKFDVLTICPTLTKLDWTKWTVHHGTKKTHVEFELKGVMSKLLLKDLFCFIFGCYYLNQMSKYCPTLYNNASYDEEDHCRFWCYMCRRSILK